MKKWLIVLAAALSLAFTVPAVAGNQTAKDNFMSPTQQQTANGNGVNIGGDYNGGGNVEGGVNATANNNNMIGNTVFGDTFSPTAKAYGGDASVGNITNKNTQTMIGGGNATSVFGDANSGNIQDQSQNQSQHQSSSSAVIASGNSASNSSVKNSGNSAVVASGNSKNNKPCQS